MKINLEIKHQTCLIHAGPTVGKSSLHQLSLIVPGFISFETDVVYKRCIPELRSLRPWRSQAGRAANNDKPNAQFGESVKANQLFESFCKASLGYILAESVSDDALAPDGAIATMIAESLVFAKSKPLDESEMTERLAYLAGERTRRLGAKYYYLLTNLRFVDIPGIMGRPKYDITIWPSSAEQMWYRSRTRDQKEGLPLSLCTKWTTEYLNSRDEMADVRVLINEGEYLFNVLIELDFFKFSVED